MNAPKAKESEGSGVDAEVQSPFVPKEISWLSFNARVLQEAADPQVPLFERIKFLGIFSSNLDEFFRVRVASLKRLTQLRKAKRLIGHSPKKVLKEVQDTVRAQHQEFDTIYRQILEELALQNIHIINETQLTDSQSEFVSNYFRMTVRRKLIPIMIDQVRKFPELRDDAIYLATILSRRNDPGTRWYALIEVPTDTVPRFLILPREGSKQYVIILDDVIRHSLKEIFASFQYDTFEAYTIKLTRDSTLDFDDDLWRSYTKKMAKSLKQRREGVPVRFIHDADLPADYLELLTTELQLSDEDTIMAGARYHNFRDYMKFPKLGGPDGQYAPSPTLSHPEIDRSRRIIETVRDKDILLHYPYQSFDYVIDFLREAAIDPDVVCIKLTIYRVAKNSSVVNALINAARNGKVVIAVLELRARFDEEANIDWGNRLQEEGVKVIFGVPGLKVHSKLCMVIRREKGRTQRYALIGTGNFNEDTALIYSDHSLFTADRRLTGEVNKVFDFYESNYKTSTFSNLMVAPFDFRRKMVKLIQTEINNAKKGKQAWIFLKLNNLVDSEIIQKLYEASQAGVKIKLIVRSMFSLRPGVKGLSENIEAIGIVDKYLEHSRVFVFCNGGKPLYFISSADLMRRNLDARVEVTCPVFDRGIQKQLQDFLDIQWRDNVKSRILDDGLLNTFRKTDGKKVRSQWAIYDYLKGL